MNYHCVSWKQLHSITHTLTEKIQKENNKLDLIVGIARGGLTIAHIASDFLKLPVASFTISSYKDLKQQKMSDISYHVGGDLKNKHILLIDDVSDTGKTFVRGIKYLTELGAASITTASPYIKPWTKHLPDFYVKSVDEWIVFPYDMRETVEAIKTNLLKDGKMTNDIKKQLSLMKIPKVYITKFLSEE
ncbi:MAG: phosphoribosyltransferase family protein [Candidatus Roizmanbacteria bacterium]|nr:phosphoribosyltransferase family protein [Candidatus Roizmanbacteria bacterium]